MAISPLRFSIFQGAQAMQRGMQNPFQPARKEVYNGGVNNQLPRAGGSTGASNPASPVGSSSVNNAPRSSDRVGGLSPNKKPDGFNNTAAGNKQYGMTGRQGPNIGPVGASGQAGYNQRTMKQAAQNAMKNTQLKQRSI